MLIRLVSCMMLKGFLLDLPSFVDCYFQILQDMLLHIWKLILDTSSCGFCTCYSCINSSSDIKESRSTLPKNIKILLSIFTSSYKIRENLCFLLPLQRIALDWRCQKLVTSIPCILFLMHIIVCLLNTVVCNSFYLLFLAVTISCLSAA